MRAKQKAIALALTAVAVCSTPVTASGLPLRAPAEARSSLAPAPNVFGSIGLPLGHTRYSDRWSRVAFSDEAPELGRMLQPARSLPELQRAQFVNAALNHRIRYAFDTDPSGDSWATAGETMRKGSGDCEDYVIAKMQALRRLGVPADALYMTIGQDAAAGVAHAILLVRASGRFFVLDNRFDRPVPQESYADFYPIISFSAAGRSWLHGYPVGHTPPVVREMSIAFMEGRHGPNVGGSPASEQPRRI